MSSELVKRIIVFNFSWLFHILFREQLESENENYRERLRTAVIPRLARPNAKTG